MKIKPANPARVFFALWPNHEERIAIAAWQQPLQALCGGRQTPLLQLHCTLVFLGEIELQRLEALKLAAAAVKGTEFQMVFNSARYWEKNHILYASPDLVPNKLIDMVNDLESSLQQHQFAVQKQVYEPHITLLRHAHWSDIALPAMQAVAWGVCEFSLVNSVNTQSGSSYEVISRFPLSGIKKG